MQIVTYCLFYVAINKDYAKLNNYSLRNIDLKKVKFIYKIPVGEYLHRSHLKIRDTHECTYIPNIIKQWNAFINFIFKFFMYLSIRTTECFFFFYNWQYKFKISILEKSVLSSIWQHFIRLMLESNSFLHLSQSTFLYPLILKKEQQFVVWIFV